jgi:uroporphyrinogen-III synthase
VIRVAITSDRFEHAAVPFREAGFEPVRLPCIRVAPAGEAILSEARQAIASADLLLISSVRTIDLLWPDDAMPAVSVAAVGVATAQAAADRGGRVVAYGRGGMADLLDRSGDGLEGSRVVFPHGGTRGLPTWMRPDKDSSAIRRLRSLAGDLQEFEVYQTLAQPPSMDPVAAAAFASPSAVAGWSLSRRLDGLVIGVIGPTTAKAVAIHRSPDVMAPRPTHQALAQAMASYMEVFV